MAGARRSSRERGKSDSIDAFNVARAALREGIENLPAPGRRRARHSPAVDHREDLIAARGQDQQRLRWHLHRMRPEREIPARALDTRKWLGKVSCRAGSTGSCRGSRSRARSIMRRLGRNRLRPRRVD
jgi:hypothetical protein